VSYNLKRAEQTLLERYAAEFKKADDIMNAIQGPEDNPYSDKVTEENVFKYKKDATAVVEALLPVFKKVKELVSKLHSVNILHNDLKADNVMVMKDGTLRLIDFDMSTLNDSLEPFQKKQEIKDFIRASLPGWFSIYPDLYTRLLNA
jgi:tRNA A-37 threonylcarbamoyl transferase component Bud32